MEHTHPHTEHHIAPNSMYYGIFFILMICTGLTYFVWTIDLGFVNILAALGIAIFKATLVIRYFMHIKWSPMLSKVALLIAITFLGILLVFISMDFASRGLVPKNQGWEKHQILESH